MQAKLIALLCSALAALASGPDGARAQDCDSGTFDGAFAGEVLVPQNWNCAERSDFWFTDQGSQIIPYGWFLHLEQANSSEKFIDPAHIDGFRYLPQEPTMANPDGLPIGFTRGNARNNQAYARISERWLGMTCAACHTGQIEHDGKKYLIDGAPTMGDFEGMFVALAEAMQATLDDPQKFERFADAVIAESQASGDGGSESKAALRIQLETITRIRDDWNQRNRGTSPYGHARLDAIGAIFNEIAATGLGDPGNVDLADAPVSYPFIWDTPQHDVVQWNGSVPNAGPGAFGRNLGEVLGVFGALDLNTSLFSRRGHATSIDIDGLADLEELLWTLWSPRWQDTELPAIDQALAARGKADYEMFCSSCHETIDRTDPGRRIKAEVMPVFSPGDPNELDTDPAMATNFLTKTAKARQLTHRFVKYWGVLSNFRTFRRSERDMMPKAAILGYTVFGSITRAFLNDPKAALRAVRAGQSTSTVGVVDEAAKYLDEEPGSSGVRRFLREVEERLAALREDSEPSPCAAGAARIPCYKARPLNGIWATAPYLHNGSVRTLRQLLLPEEERETVFDVGSRQFDADAIGFVNEGATTLDTRLPGNSNGGHDGPIYGNDVFANDPARLDAILEYLKTL